MGEFKPVDDFEVIIKHPPGYNDAMWFIIRREEGVRIHTHSHHRNGPLLKPDDLRKLKEIVDYLVENHEPSLQGAQRAIHSAAMIVVGSR